METAAVGFGPDVHPCCRVEFVVARLEPSQRTILSQRRLLERKEALEDERRGRRLGRCTAGLEGGGREEDGEQAQPDPARPRHVTTCSGIGFPPGR